MTMSSHSSDESDNWTSRRNLSRRTKRRKLNRGSHSESFPVTNSLSFEPLLRLLSENCNESEGMPFEQLMEDLLPDYLRHRTAMLQTEYEQNKHGEILRPPTGHEVSSLMHSLDGHGVDSWSPATAIVLRKLKLQRERIRACFPNKFLKKKHIVHVTPPDRLHPIPTVNPHVIDGLYSIRTTPYENSFLSRISGCKSESTPGIISVDWKTTSAWMDLMSDIRAHYSLAHPERDQPNEFTAAIEYTSLQLHHLPQVHDLLARVFWTGIDVSDSLQCAPESCTVVATYKRLVIGAAILSSPQETYITYLAVRTGWDNAQVATTMLYHLISLNPNKDITLHVSANNPAMLLYNRFGFKAEEFVVGFYEDYLDPQSRASKNAFRLRLRQ